MIKIIRLCGDVFADEKRTLEALSAGLRDHVTRLTGYPHGGAFDVIIITTQALLTRWNTTELAINVGQNTQQGGHLATDADLTKALNRLRRNYSALDALEDDEQREKLLQRFYPQGKEQYTDAKIDSLVPLLEAYLKLVTDTPAGDLPDGFAARTTPDFAAFDTARDEQVEQQGDTTRARQTRQEMVDEVTNLLTDNYHFLCWHFRAGRGQVLGFFNRRYFEDADAAAEDAVVAAIITPPPPG